MRLYGAFENYVNTCNKHDSICIGVTLPNGPNTYMLGVILCYKRVYFARFPFVVMLND